MFFGGWRRGRGWAHNPDLKHLPSLDSQAEFKLLRLLRREPSLNRTPRIQSEEEVVKVDAMAAQRAGIMPTQLVTCDSCRITRSSGRPPPTPESFLDLLSPNATHDKMLVNSSVSSGPGGREILILRAGVLTGWDLDGSRSGASPRGVRMTEM
ncbi:unnamed protein product [Pleuronectes platessa]|uniref:Uncharacterized protein n=1 Tax=Pleuronectes platessa TaxID=8262 RepID=A0A9N7VLX2_PLEPL|nr:unnamed protein product [Pleuronectes platessa]